MSGSATLPTPGTSDLVWLVTVDGAGTPIRLASRAVSITDATTGASYVYGPGVASVSLTEEIAEPGQDATEASASVTILEPTNAAVLAARGHTLTMRVAEVALWVDGTDWSRRQVRVRGVVLNPEWGLPGEPVRFSVAARLWDDPSTIPGAFERVDGTTWANASTLTSEHLGRIYPIVIGTPGVVSTTVASSGRIEATRGLWAEHSPTYVSSANTHGIILVIAGHHVGIGANGTYGGRIYGRDQDGENEARFRVRNGFDNRGQPIAWIPWWSTYTSAPADQFDYDGNTPGWSFSQTESDSVITYGIGHTTVNNAYVTTEQLVPFLSWSDDIDGGGGLIWRGILLRNAADVVHWAVAQTGQNVDSSSFISVREALAPFLIDCVIEGDVGGERTNVWEWLKSNILPMLPVSLAVGPSGVYPILWRWSAGAADAEVVLDLDIDPSISLASAVRVDTGTIRNRFTAKYARNLRTGDYAGSITIGPDDYVATSPTVLPSAICALSASLYRHPNGRPYIAEEEVELPCVYADSTAVAVLESMAQRQALAVETVDLSVPLATYGRRLARGTIVAVTMADLGWSGRAAMVMSVTATSEEDTVMIGLRMLPALSALWRAA